MNGEGPSNPRKVVPRSRTHHSRSPSLSRGPSQILLTALASWDVKQSAGFPVQDKALALKWQDRGSWMTPSVIPSSASQAAIDAVFTALSFATEIGAPTS